MSNPQATDLGNVGMLSFPHSISDLFRVGNDIYAFIPNVTGRSLTRIRFAGCRDIPGTTVKDPPPVTYANPGVYNINLLVDLGLPTQTSYCQQITVNASPQGKLTGDTVCYGTAPALLFNGKGTAPLTTPGASSFTLQKIIDATGCSTAANATTNILIAPIPQGGISGTASVCGQDSTLVVFQPSKGQAPYQVQLSNGSNLFAETGISGTASFKLPFLSGPTTFSLTALLDKYGCARTSGFDNATVTVTPLPAPAVLFKSLDSVCISNKAVLITAASETTGLGGSGAYSGPGIDAGGNFVSAQAGAGKHTIKYAYTADDGCTSAGSSVIVVDPLPVIHGPSAITACIGVPVQVAVSGGLAYEWSPAAYMDHPNAANPVITVDTTTTFFVQVTDSNGCKAADTITIKAAISANTAFVVPNAFTPNGDGHNDRFGIQRWGDVILEQFAIYNRVGACVFSTNNPSDSWDGSFKGQLTPAGGYVYIIKARTACGEITRKGLLMLIR